MFKSFYLTIAAILFYGHIAVAIEYSTEIDNRERCETCKALFSSQNVNWDEIDSYDGFEGFSVKYGAIQQYGVEDPELICTLTNMCLFNDAEEEEELTQSELNNLDVLYSDNDWAVQSSPNDVILKTKLKNPVCSACKKIFAWVLQQIQNLADKRPNKGVVRGFFSKGCKHIPKFLQGSCHTLIEKKIGKLVKMALERYAPKLACKLVKACF